MILLLLLICLMIILGCVTFVILDKQSKKENSRREIQIQIDFCNYYYETINMVKKYDWEALLKYHKAIIKHGIQNRNVLPDIYGMFRTSDILSMTFDEIYLGGIFGLFTNTLSHWLEITNVNSDKNVLDIIWDQYKYLLTSNIKAIRMDYEDKMRELK